MMTFSILTAIFERRNDREERIFFSLFAKIIIVDCFWLKIFFVDIDKNISDYKKVLLFQFRKFFIPVF